MAKRRRKAMSKEERKKRNREHAKLYRARKKAAMSEEDKSGWVIGQTHIAYEPTPEEIAEHCRRFREEKLKALAERPVTDAFVPNVFSWPQVRDEPSVI